MGGTFSRQTQRIVRRSVPYINLAYMPDQEYILAYLHNHQYDFCKLRFFRERELHIRGLVRQQEIDN